MKKFVFLLVSMLLSVNFIASAVDLDYVKNTKDCQTEQKKDCFSDEEIPLAKAYNKYRPQLMVGFDGIRVYKRKYRTVYKKNPLMIQPDEESLKQKELKYKKCQNVLE